MPVAAAVVSALLLVSPFPASLQPTGAIRIEVSAGGKPLAGAAVKAGDRETSTDARGVAIVTVPAGTLTLVVSLDGYLPAAASVDVAPGTERVVGVELTREPEHEEAIIVSATRTNRGLEDQPMRVEVLGREEIEEKMLMTPGDIVMMLNEMGGMRVQATSPSLGAASVRIQGMRGRYTRFFSDGLPLHGQVGGLGLLQIPPMDLGQVEVIKGVASALYGAGAMGGVVDLASRRPGPEPEREVLFNQTSRHGTDAVLWLSGALRGGWSGTLLAGAHRQSHADVDDDAWADLPGYRRGVARPRFFWHGDAGGSFFGTVGVTWEERSGGTLDGRVLEPLGAPYVESLDTLRLDGGVAGTTVLAGRYVLTTRAAASRQRHDHRFGPRLERDRHTTLFGEAALRAAAGRHTWVAGAAIERDVYNPRDLPRFGHTFTVPGVFAQDDVDITPWLAASVSARLDRHSEYGIFFSPRVSVLARRGPWTARASGGTGFFAPTAITEETEAAGLEPLTIPRPLRAERGRSASLDLTRAMGPITSTLTIFGSRIRNPVTVFRERTYELVNLPSPSTNLGIEALVTIRHEPFIATGTYTYVRARETSEAGTRADAPLTPRHAAGLVAMLESEDSGRLGLEIYFTGRQTLDANPYRAASEPYIIVGVLAEKRFERFRVFVNGENLTGVRQSRWDSLLRPAPSPDGRWTVDAWAPLEGRVINGGIRLAF